MRYAILSDIHANLQAFEAVLTDLSVQRVDRVVCLGDAVGYGPQPAEVLSLANAHVNDMLLGNHEAAVTGSTDTENFTPGAAASLAQTRRKLNGEALRYLAALPVEFSGPDFACTHSDFSAPDDFLYVESAADAQPSFLARTEPLLFVGHTHAPAVYVLEPDGTCRAEPAEDFTLQPGCRYLVNPGSVGMPRTQDPRATYCVYDDTAQTVVFHRTSYSVQTFRKLIEQDSAESEQRTYVLSLLDNHALPLLNARVDFAARQAEAKPRPHDAADKGARGTAKRVVLVGSGAGGTTGAWSAAGSRAGRSGAKSASRPRQAPARPASSGALVATLSAVVVACFAGGIVAVVKVRQAAAHRAAARPAPAVAPALARANVAPPPASRPAPKPTPTPPAPAVKPAPARLPAVTEPAEQPATAAQAHPETPAPTPGPRPPNGIRFKWEGGHEKIPLKVKDPATAAWVVDGKAKPYQANLTFPAANMEWRKREWSVMPERDGRLTLVLGGQIISVRERRWMLYDDVQLEGAELLDGDFENAKAWNFDPTGERARILDDPALAHGGTHCLMAGSPATVSQAMNVKAGRELKLTFWYRAVP